LSYSAAEHLRPVDRSGVGHFLFVIPRPTILALLTVAEPTFFLVIPGRPEGANPESV